MKTDPANCVLSRRDFLASTAGLSLAAAMQSSVLGAPPAPPAVSKTIGIQIGSVSFVDEGVEALLDALQESDEKSFHGGNFAMPHPEFYRSTILKETRAPDHGDLDILEAVLPAAKKRGLKVFCSCEDAWRSSVPGFSEVAEIDLNGRKTGAQCLFHPDVRHFWTGLVTDLCRSYSVDGILFFNERNSPLLNALGASHAQTIESGRVTCFCEHHRQAARQLGIDADRASSMSLFSRL